MNDKGFKDCPFCGAVCKDGTVCDHEESGDWFIVCWGCGASGPAGKTLEIAAKNWNERK